MSAFLGLAQSHAALSVQRPGRWLTAGTEGGHTQGMGCLAGTLGPEAPGLVPGMACSWEG